VIGEMRQRIEAHLETRQVGRVIYGAIIGLAVVVVMESHPPRPALVAGTLVATGVAVGLAELYSEAVGTETRMHRRVRRRELAEMLDDAIAVFFGVSLPATFFLLAAIGILEEDTAFTVAKWSGVGLIGFYGYAAASLAGAGIGTRVLQAIAAALIGTILIAFKALVH
jgi:hypothetical protein